MDEKAGDVVSRIPRDGTRGAMRTANASWLGQKLVEVGEDLAKGLDVILHQLKVLAKQRWILFATGTAATVRNGQET